MEVRRRGAIVGRVEGPKADHRNVGNALTASGQPLLASLADRSTGRKSSLLGGVLRFRRALLIDRAVSPQCEEHAGELAGECRYCDVLSASQLDLL